MNIVLPRLLKLIIPFLLCACIISASSGCTYVEIGGGQGDETTEIIAVETIGKPIKSDSKQAVAITEHLEQLSFDREIDAVTMESKINLFRSGGSPLHVRLDPNIFYFICGYYDSTHENETEKYCCASEYTWVRYESEKEIREFYNGTPLVAAFQINKSIEVFDVLEGKLPPSFEHYQIYEPIFEDGINVNAPAELTEESFIYLNASDDLDICHSSSAYYHGMTTIPCVEIDGEYYVTMPLDEDLDSLLSREFGEYAEAFASIIDVEKYSVIDENGEKHPCGAFKLDGFMKEFSKIVSKDRLLAQLKKDFGTNAEKIEFVATEILRGWGASISEQLFVNYSTKLQVLNDNLYLDGILFDSVEIVQEPNFDFLEDLSSYIPNTEKYDEKRQIFNQIQYAPSCYVLSSKKYPKRTELIYVIDSNYYIIKTINNEIYYITEYILGE